MAILQPAIKCFRKSLELVKGTGNLLGEGTAFGNLGSVLRDAGELKEAIECHYKYLDTAGQRLDTGGEAIMQYELAVDHLLLGEKEKCQEFALRGLHTLDIIRSRLELSDDQLKLGNYEKNQAKIYNILQHVFVEMGKIEAALLVSELGRARALCDLMKNQSKVESALTTEISGLLSDPSKLLNQEVVVSICGQLSSLATELHSTILIYSIVHEPVVGGMRKKWLYIWVIPPRSDKKSVIRFEKKLISQDNVQLSLEEDCISGLRRDIKLKKKSVSTNQAKSVASSIPVSTSLHSDHHSKCLIAPIESYLNESNNPLPRLLIIPYDYLLMISFASLKNTKGKFLVEEFVLSYAPSLSILDLLAKKALFHQPAERSAPFIVGNPLMPHPEIEQLVGAEEEAIVVQNTLGGEMYLSKHATKEVTIANLSRHSIIHFATHALLGDSVAEHLEATQVSDDKDSGDYTVKGAIVLAKSSPYCSGILTSKEVQELDLSSCQLVTLSCCRTACGKITGDGILGLSRALLVAGVTCLVSTLWAIEDKPTVELMRSFYDHYKTSNDAALAMRCAMLSAIRQGNRPAEQWAAFCVTGVSPGMANTC